MSQTFKQCTFVFADEDNTGVKLCRLDRDHAGDHEAQQNTRHVYEDDIALLKPSTHRTLTADPQYVGPHRRYVACLGCFDEAQSGMAEIVAAYSDAERRVVAMGETVARYAKRIHELEEFIKETDHYTTYGRLKDVLYPEGEQP